MAKGQRNVPSCLDLFCGIGGLTLGLHAAGIQTIGGVDHWAEAKATFDHNLKPATCMLADLTKTTAREIEQYFGVTGSQIDIIAGGPPCQGFSTVGKRDHADPRNALWTAYRDIVSAIRPAYIIIENVEGLIVSKNGQVRDSIISSFAEIGYGMKCKLLTSADYGIPQLRKRAVFLGWLEGLVEPNYPAPLKSKRVSVADAIFDLPVLLPSQIVTEYDKAPQTTYQKARRKGVTLLCNHEAAPQIFGQVVCIDQDSATLSFATDTIMN